MRNDAAPDLEAFRVEPKEGIEYIVAYDQGEALAVFLLTTKANRVEVHTCFLPEAWGVTVHITECFLSWVWANTKLTRLVAPVPSYNRLVLRLAKMTGFKKMFTKANIGARRGKSFDLIMLEIRKAGVRSQ